MEKENAETHLVVPVLLEFFKDGLDLFLGGLWHSGLLERKERERESNVYF